MTKSLVETVKRRMRCIPNDYDLALFERCIEAIVEGLEALRTARVALAETGDAYRFSGTISIIDETLAKVDADTTRDQQIDAVIAAFNADDRKTHRSHPDSREHYRARRPILAEHADYEIVGFSGVEAKWIDA
jgi:hypothetical protein